MLAKGEYVLLPITVHSNNTYDHKQLLPGNLPRLQHSNIKQTVVSDITNVLQFHTRGFTCPLSLKKCPLFTTTDSHKLLVFRSNVSLLMAHLSWSGVPEQINISDIWSYGSTCSKCFLTPKQEVYNNILCSKYIFH